METTGKALVEHWNWAISKGLMNKNTGAALRSACAKIMPVVDNWEGADVRELDVEETLTRFVNLRSQEYTPESLESYKRRFRQAVSSFLDYANDPASWKPTQREGQRKNGSASSRKANPSNREIDGERAFKGTNLHEYDFPLREDVMAKLIVPRDVTNAEMKRLLAWARTLAVDFDDAE